MRIVGVDIGVHEARLAWGERTLGSVRLTGVERVTLAALAARLPAARTEVRGALPLAAVTHRLLTLPFRDRGRLGRVVPLEFLGHLPTEPDGAEIVFAPLGRTGTGATVLAAVARRDDLAAQHEELGRIGTNVGTVDLAPLPVWTLVPDALGDAALVVADGAHSTVSVRRGGRLAGLRALDTTPGVPAFAGAVRWTLAALGGAPATIVLAGPEAAATAATLADAGVRTLPLARVARVATPPDIDLTADALAVALALGPGRTMAALSFGAGRNRRPRSLVRTASLAAAALLLALGDWALVRHDLVRREVALAAAIRTEAATVLPAARLTAPRAELEAAVGALVRRGLGPGAPGGTLALLRDVSARVPPTLRTDLDELGIAADELTLHGRVESFDAVDTLRRALAASPLLSDVTATDTHTSVDGRRIEFRLRATRRRTLGAPS